MPDSESDTTMGKIKRPCDNIFVIFIKCVLLRMKNDTFKKTIIIQQIFTRIKHLLINDKYLTGLQIDHQKSNNINSHSIFHNYN